MAKKKKHGSIKRVVTCSAGVSVATTLEKILGSDTLVEHADKALYEAKEAGRNRVYVYGDHQASSSRGGRAKSD